MLVTFDQGVTIALVTVAALLVPLFYRLVGISQVVEQLSFVRAVAIGMITMCGLFFVLSRASDLVQIMLGK